MRNTTMMNTSPGTLNAPAGYSGENAPINGSNAADAAPEVTKAVNTMSKSNGAAPSDPEAQTILNMSAAIVIGCIVLLWMLGGLVFKTARVP